MTDAVDTISKADIVTCAVGPTILKFIAKPISDAIIKRTAEKVSSPYPALNMARTLANSHLSSLLLSLPART